MKIYNKILLLSVIATAGVLSSCSDDDGYTPAPMPGLFAYFDASTPSSFTLTNPETPITLSVMRSEKEGALSIPVTVTPASETTQASTFSFPATIEFAAGENTSTFTFTYSVATIDMDDPQEFLIEIAKEYSSPYGISSHSITCVYPSTWTKVATGNYEYLVPSLGNSTPLDLYQNDVNPSRYYIEGWMRSYDFAFTVGDDNIIMVEDQMTPYSISGSSLWVTDLVDYTGGTSYGQSEYDPEEDTYWFSNIYYFSGGIYTYGDESFHVTERFD